MPKPDRTVMLQALLDYARGDYKEIDEIIEEIGEEMRKPQNGLVTDVKVTRIIDADTIEVEVKRTFPLRLDHHTVPDNIIFNAPEKNTPEGKDAIDFVRDMLEDAEVQAFIPAGKSLALTDINSFNRILGNLYVHGWGWLTNVLLERGHAELKEK